MEYTWCIKNLLFQIIISTWNKIYFLFTANCFAKLCHFVWKNSVRCTFMNVRVKRKCDINRLQRARKKFLRDALEIRISNPTPWRIRRMFFLPFFSFFRTRTTVTDWSSRFLISAARETIKEATRLKSRWSAPLGYRGFPPRGFHKTTGWKRFMQR